MSYRARLGALALAMVLAACGRGAGAQDAPPPPEVGVVEIAAQAYEMNIELSGRVTPYEISEVRPQIGGIVRSRNFREGASVRAGQVLYEIDPGTARAQLTSVQAAAASAQARYERYQQLIAIGAVSQQELDDARAAADQARGALEAARISVGYTQIRAPIGGIIGASSVTAGALATPSQAQPFAVIQQIDRVYVDMTLSSSELMRIRRTLERNRSARVRLTLQDGTEYARDGQLQFSDITVNQNTGAVRLRALFANPNHTLLPGMWVQARVSLGTDEDAILAPQRGVSRNARGEAVVMLLTPDNKVEQRVIQVSGTAGDQWVVESGLSPGDRVIVEGVQRVQPGATAIAAPPSGQPTQEGVLELRGRRQG